MASKSMKPSAAARPLALTPEQKAEQVARFLSQKRESFALTFFAGLSRHSGIMGSDPAAIADYSVKAADALMEKLYPMTNLGEEDPKK